MLFLCVFEHFRLFISSVGFYFFVVFFTFSVCGNIISSFLSLLFLDEFLSSHSNFIKLLFQVLSIFFFLPFNCFLFLFALLLRKEFFYSFFFLHIKLTISDLFMSFNSFCFILADFFTPIHNIISLFCQYNFIFRSRLHM